MAVRTKELGHATLTTVSVWVTIYTVPAGKTAIVKEISQYATAAITTHWRVTRGGSSWFVGSGDNVASKAAVIVRNLVLEPGDVLEAFRLNGSVGADVWVSGAELDGVAA